jgi:leucyl aminopeptidase
VTRGQWQHFGPFEAPAGTQVRVTMTGSGDADLYVRRGAQPTSRDYDCRPYAGGSAENCAVASGSPVFVSVYGYAASSNFQLEIRY